MTISISIWMVILEVYFNWPLESLKSENKCGSYGQNTKTGRNWEQSSRCTGTPLTCTGTLWPKMTRIQCVPVQVQSVPVQVSEKCPECVFSPIFHALFHPKPNLYFIYTSKSFQIHLIISFLLTSSFNYISFFKLFMNHFKKHSNMGYDPYTN